MSTPEIVKATVEIVPRPNLEGVELAIGKLSIDTAKLAPLRTRAEALIAKGALNWTADDCQAAKLLELDVRSVKKAAGLYLDPYWEVVKRATEALKQVYANHEDPAEAIDSQLKANVKIFEAEEKRRAEIETKRQNDERLAAAAKKAKEEREDRERKAKEEMAKKVTEIKAALKRGDIGKRESIKMLREAGAYAEAQAEQAAADAEAQVQAVKDNPVTVKADIRAVAGVPSRVNWKFRIVNPQKIPRGWMAPNESAIGEMVRRNKDKAKSEAECPGIEVFQD